MCDLLRTICFCGCLVCGLAEARESIVRFDVEGERVVGTLNLPGTDGPAPVVLLLHGFTETRDAFHIRSANEGVYARTARLWAKRGIASLRIDFRGSGDSDGEYAGTTVDGQIRDGLSALDYLASHKGVDPDRMALVGWSLGGAVGAAVAARTPHQLDAVALWAPVTDLDSTFTFLLGEDAMLRGEEPGARNITSKLPWQAAVTLHGTFFRSLQKTDPRAEIAHYTGPLLVAVGTEDAVVFPQPASGKVLLDRHPGDERLLVWPMDHIFNVSEDTATVDRLINATADFIVDHLD
jgi:dipeptidyl aminopeptidase/acylaminoacyl peptidase